MDFRRTSTRWVLFLKRLENEDEFLAALLSWQNVFTHSSDLTANLGRRYGQCRPRLPQLLPQRHPTGSEPSAAARTSDGRLASWTRRCWARPRPGRLRAVALGSPLPSVQSPTSKLQPNCFQRVGSGSPLSYVARILSGLKFGFSTLFCVE